MRANPTTLLLLLFGAGACDLEPVAADAPPPVLAVPTAADEQDITPPESAHAQAREEAEARGAKDGYPMPRPERRRLGAAVALNATCESCHKEEATEWRRSRHRQSDTNSAYQAAFAIEPTPFCRGCHAPEADPTNINTNIQIPPRAVSELGVGCVTCHVTEEGFVLASTTSQGDAPHPLRRSADFARTGGCAGCHEFRFPGAIGDADDHFMQTTVREHQRSPSAERACAECHMPLVEGRRSHAFAEVRDPVWLRKNLEATASRPDKNRVRITLVQPDPGHAYPSGDLFRRLEVGCEIRDAAGKIIQREVRHLARHFEISAGQKGRRLTRDDRVFAEPNSVEMALSPAPPWQRPAVIAWWVSLQRVATVGMGTNPADARIESSVPLHAGVLPWDPNDRSERTP